MWFRKTVRGTLPGQRKWGKYRNNSCSGNTLGLTPPLRTNSSLWPCPIASLYQTCAVPLSRSSITTPVRRHLLTTKKLLLGYKLNLTVWSESPAYFVLKLHFVSLYLEVYPTILCYNMQNQEAIQALLESRSQGLQDASEKRDVDALMSWHAKDAVFTDVGMEARVNFVIKRD